MATTNNITTTYAGEFAGKYIGPALLNANTIFNGGIEVKPNIKYKEVIKRLSIDGLMSDSTCDFTPVGDLDMDERILEPKEMQVNLQLCKADYRSDWEAEAMGYSAHDSLPPSFSDFLISRVAGKVAEANEKNLWNGDKNVSGQFDGFITILENDATASGATAVAGTSIDATNVIIELGKVVDAIKQEVYSREDLSIYVAPNVARAYVRALGGFAAAGLGGSGTDAKGTQWFTDGSLTFDGISLFVCNGMTSNQMVAAEKSNLYFGTGLVADEQEVKVIDMADIDGSQNVRMVMRFTAGVQVGVPGDIVIYTA
tara:strand:+ start:6219 stop:7157 length:939 start_codon:yes stop_codon:yes gene_type:complete